MDKYHIRLFRNGDMTGFTICCVVLSGKRTYELWHKPLEKGATAECLARDSGPEELKKLV